MRTFYVEGTKKGVNEQIAAKKKIVGVEYKLFDTIQVFLHEVHEKAVIKFWTKRDPVGNPIAKAYGNWEPAKNKIV